MSARVSAPLISIDEDEAGLRAIHSYLRVGGETVGGEGGGVTRAGTFIYKKEEEGRSEWEERERRVEEKKEGEEKEGRSRGREEGGRGGSGGRRGGRRRESTSDNCSCNQSSENAFALISSSHSIRLW